MRDITDGAGCLGSREPDIHNGQVVWRTTSERPFYFGETFYWDGSSVRTLTVNYGDCAYHPQIHNGQVVWYRGHDIRDERFFTGTARVYGSSPTTVIVNNDPQIHNGQVVWQGGTP